MNGARRAGLDEYHLKALAVRHPVAHAIKPSTASAIEKARCAVGASVLSDSNPTPITGSELPV